MAGCSHLQISVALLHQRCVLRGRPPKLGRSVMLLVGYVRTLLCRDSSFKGLASAIEVHCLYSRYHVACQGHCMLMALHALHPQCLPFTCCRSDLVDPRLTPRPWQMQ